MSQSTSRVGKRGAMVIPAALRRRLGIDEGSLLIAEGMEEGILLRPAPAVPLESYNPERKAEFLLSNAVDGEDYARAEEEEVRKLGGSTPPPSRTAGLRGASSGASRYLSLWITPSFWTRTSSSPRVIVLMWVLGGFGRSLEGGS